MSALSDQAGKGKGSGTGASRSGGAPGSGSAPDFGAYPAGRGARYAVYAVLGVLGLLTGAAGALVEEGWFPFGLLLALAAAVGLFWGGAKLVRTKTGAAAPAVGWVVAVMLLTSTRPEGDFVFAAGVGSYVYLLGGLLAAVMCTTIALPAPPVPANKYR